MRAVLRPQFASIARQAPARRFLSTSSLTRAAIRPSSKIATSSLRASFRRSYAELKPTAPIAPVTPVAPIVKRRKFRIFRWLWRATYLSALGGVAYLVYGVYDLRHPDDQFEPDPSKQNLVILGMCYFIKMLESG